MRSWFQTRITTMAAAALLVTGAGMVALAAVPAEAGSTCTTTTPTGTTYSVQVCLTVGPSGGVASGDVPVSATVSATGTPLPKFSKLVFALRGQYLLTDYEAPYQFTLHTPDFVDGAAALSVYAVMRDGNDTVDNPASLTTTFVNGVTVQPGPTGSYSPPTAPTATQTAPFVVAAVGDGAGGETAATNVTDMIASWSPGMVTYLGDVYEDGTITEFKNWYGDATSWYGRFRSITAPVVGNHEYNPVDPNATPKVYAADGYFRYWNDIPHYYSFDAGGWHWIALDSTDQYGQTGVGSPQYDWLANDLATRSNPCTIVTYHHPLNTIGSEPPSQRMSDIWALLRQHDVTLVLNGHDHQYQHWTALDGAQQPDPAGVTQLIAGAGGHSSQGITGADPRVVGTAQAYGALRLEVRPDRVEYSYREASGGSGKELDRGFVSCKGLTPDTTAPTVPTGVTATVNPSPTAVSSATVSWAAASDNRGVAQYQVLRDGVVVGTVPGSVTSFTNTGLSAGSTFSFTVKAMDAAGNLSAASAAATATTPAPTAAVETLTPLADAYVTSTSPTSTTGNTATTLRLDADAPVQTSYLRFRVTQNSYPNITRATLKVLANNTNKVGITAKKVASTTWVDSPAASGLTWSTAPAAGVQVGAVTPTTANSWASIDVTSAVTSNNADYAFQLSTTSATAFTVASREATAANRPLLVVESVPPPDTTAPSVPAGLTATATGQNQVDLAWTAATDNNGGTGVASYTVYRDGVVVDSVPAGTTTYRDLDVGAGRTYGYTVDAVDAAGNRSAQSAAATATPPDETPPNTPDPYSAVATSTTTVAVSWGASTDNVGITGYRLRRGNAVIAQPGVTATSFTDTGRTPGATYTYTLQAKDAAGNFSDAATATVTMPTNSGSQPPTAPTSFTASVLGETGIQLSWSGATDDTGISGYQISRNGSVVLIVPGTDSSWSDTGLTPGTLYTYSIRTIDLNANFSPSVSVSATTLAPDTVAPTVPTGLAGAGASLTSVSLSWNASTDARGVASYRVYRDGTAIGDVTAPATTFVDQGLSVGESHVYSVDAVDAAGNRSAPSAGVTVRTQVPPPVTTTFPVTADTYANPSNVTATSQGTATTWRLDGDPVTNAYLKFRPQGLQPVVTAVSLCVTSNAKASPVVVKATSSAWTESTLSFSTAPAGGATLATTAATTAAGAVCVALPASAVTGDGDVSFQLSQASTTAVAFASREVNAGSSYLQVTSAW